MSLIFTLGANSMTIDARALPVHDPDKVNVVVDYTDGGQLCAYNKGIAEKLWHLDCQLIDAATAAGFAEWLTDIAVGPLNPFTFTDEASNTHTVRLMDTQNPLKQVSNGRYSGVITLREEIP